MEENKPSSFKLRSGNTTAFKQMGSSQASPMKGRVKGREKSGRPYTGNSSQARKNWENANMTSNPSIHRNTMFQGDYLGEGGWNQDIITRENSLQERSDWNGDGKISRDERRKGPKPYNSYLRELKHDLKKPQLTGAMADRGYSQVQDQWGYWHIIDKNGNPSNKVYSKLYPKQSQAWRRGEVWDPNAGPGGKGGYVPYTGQGFDHDKDGDQTQYAMRHLNQGGGVPEGGTLNEFEPLQEPIHLEKRTIDEIPTEELPGPVIQGPPVTPQEGGDDVTTEETSDDTQEYASRDEAFAAARERGDKQFGYDTDGDGEIGPNEYYHTRLDTETKDEWNAKFGGGDTPSPGPEPGDDTIAHSEGVSGPKSADQVDMEPSVGGGDDPLTQEIMDTSDISSDDGGGDSDPVVIEKDEKDDSPNKRRGFRFKRNY